MRTALWLGAFHKINSYHPCHTLSGCWCFQTLGRTFVSPKVNIYFNINLNFFMICSSPPMLIQTTWNKVIWSDLHGTWKRDVWGMSPCRWCSKVMDQLVQWVHGLYAPVCRSHPLSGMREIMRQCHSHQRQFGMNAPFTASLFRVSPHKGASRQRQEELWRCGVSISVWKRWLHSATLSPSLPEYWVEFLFTWNWSSRF